MILKWGNILTFLDELCLYIFVLELVLKLFAFKFKFFCNAWNLFDFIIIVISLGIATPAIKSMRFMRTIRGIKILRAVKGAKAFRLVSGVDSFRVISTALVKSTHGLMWSALYLGVIFYIYAIIGTNVFGIVSQRYFGDLGTSMYTLFQIMTGESWSESISRPIMEELPWAWVYFISFIFISSFVLLNIVTAIIVDAVMSVREADREAKNNQNIQL